MNHLKNQYPDAKGSIEIFEGDLNSFESVIQASNKVAEKYPVIDLIVYNAGIMNFEPKQKKNGRLS